MTDYLQIFLAVLSTVTTGFAAYAAWKAPRSAASLAEQLREAGDKANEKRRLKLHIFATLMQERAAFYSLEAVRAFNLIDVVYYDCRKVRDCWAEFLESLAKDAAMPVHVQSERFRKLLEAMAEDLNLASQLRPDDFARTYYPTAIEEDDKVKELQRKQMLANLQGQSPSANSTPSQWPPKPTKK
jgi:hypothetical protein